MAADSHSAEAAGVNLAQCDRRLYRIRVGRSWN